MPRRPDIPFETADAIAAVRNVYAAYEALPPPERSCIGRADCCHFQRTGRTPYLTLGEALVAVKAWRATGRGEVPPLGPDGACPFLAEGRCRIHFDRPFGCRTHFCAAAGGPVSRGEARPWIQRLEAIDHSLGGEGGVNLPAALACAAGLLAGKSRKRKLR
ncbi:MAG: YkgJ family cysteine cluster protein [Verrucomicrobiales bacterium]